jgi:glyoxylase-like metal-dependent hydrolase (beta-lactamase superfamily II)
MSTTTLPFGITAIRHEFSIPLGQGKTLPRWVLSFALHRERWIAVDAGVRGATSSILATTDGELSALLLTHGHPDHLGGARSLSEQTGCLVAASEMERSCIETPDVQFEARPVPGFFELVEGGVPIDRTLGEGTRIFGDLGLQSLVTPGHSPGHLAFWEPEDRILFSGDAIPVPGEMPIYDDARKVVASLERLRALEPIALLLSAWDEPREGASALAALDEGMKIVQSVQECVAMAKQELGEAADLTAMTEHVACGLGLPAHLAGPMLARTVRAHLGP